MKPLAKIGMVVLGYILAVPAAISVVVLHGWLFPTPDSSGGMAAFSDLLLFLLTFGVLALVPTGLALYWLVAAFRQRSHPGVSVAN